FNYVSTPDSMKMQYGVTALAALAILTSAAALTATLILALGPWLERYAVAEPNSRSSHKLPTPQGGGIAVVAATVVVSGAALFSSAAAGANALSLVGLFSAAILIAAVGVMADKRPIAPAPRLILQSFAVIAALNTLSPELRLMPMLPWWTER